MHDARTSLSKEVASEVRAFFGAKVYETMIPRNVRVAEAPSHGKPILLYDYDCPGSQAYIKLAHRDHRARAPAAGGVGRGRASATPQMPDRIVLDQPTEEIDCPWPYPCRKADSGRGLASLIGETPEAEPRLPAHGEQRLLSIDQLHPSGFNPRKAFDDVELAELADSIRSKGLLQPIIARPDRAARRLRDRRRRAPLAGGAEGRPAHRAGDRARALATWRPPSSR